MASKSDQVQTDFLFFSGKGSPLPKYITRDDIYDLFSEFESYIKTVVLFRDSAKQSLGRGFVTFTSAEVATAALGSYQGKLFIDSIPVYLNYYRKRNRPVKTEPAPAKPTAPQTSKRSRHKGSSTKKRIPKVESYELMVCSKTGKLPITVNKDDLTKHFNAIVDTPVHSVSLPCDDGVSLGYGIIEYRDRRAAIEARVKLHQTKLCDKHVLYVQLESPLDHLEITTLQCSAHESVFLRHYFHDKKTYTFNNCTVDVIEKNESLKIVSSRNDLKPAEAAIRDSLLQGLHHSHTTFHCDEEYVSIFRIKARAISNEPELTCIVQENSDRYVVAVFVFSCESSFVEESTKKLKKLNPQCKTFSLHPEAPRVLKSIEQTLQSLAQKHHTVLKHVGQHFKAIRLYGLQAIDIENAWKDIKNQVDSTAVTETIPLTSMQVKYLQNSQAGCLNEIKGVAELVIRESSPVGQKPLLNQISITAELRDIFRHVNKLKKAAKKCIVEYFQISCSQKHLLPWRKRWDSFVQIQCSRKDIYVAYCIESDHEKGSELCTISFDICANNVDVTEEVKTVLANVENGQAFTEHTITTLSQREINYIQKNKVAVTDSLQKAHAMFLDLQISDGCSLSILIASELDPVKIEEIYNTLLKHLQNITSKRLKFLDSVAGAILVKEKLPKLQKCCDKVNFIFSTHKNCTVFEMQGMVADVNAAEAHIVEQLHEIKLSIVRTDQLLLKKTSFPLLLSSTIPLLKGDQLLSCSYPTVSHRESLLSVKCIQTASGHIVTIELCDNVIKQCHPDAVLCTRNSISFGSSTEDNCTRLNDFMAVTYLPALVDANADITSPKCELNVSINNCPSLSEGLLTGLNEIHQRNYGVIKIKSQCALQSSSKWLLEVLNSVKQYVILHPKTTIHTIQVILIPPIMRSKNEFDRYSFSISANPTDNVSCKASTKLRWYWEEHGGYNEYDQAVSDQINLAWNCDSHGKCQLVINFQIYNIDFNSMTQTNLSTGFSRQVKNDQHSSEQQASAAVQWSYLDDTGNFSCYTLIQSEQIENMYSHKRPVTTLSINGWEYSIDFDRMLQVNVTSQRERPIKREQLKTTESSTSNIKTLDPCDTLVVNMRGHPLSIETAKDSIIATVTSLIKSEKISYPPSLSVEAEFFNQVEKIVADLKYVKYKKSCTHPSSSNVIEISGERELLLKAQNQIQTEILNCLSSKQLVEYPPEWELQYKSCQLFPIKRNSSEWKRIVKLFKTTLHNVKIVEISRVQNKILWQKYQQDKVRICEKNNGDSSEKELFHGSRSVKAEDIVKGEDGLDMRYSAEGMWGRANYFAVNSSYSDSYAYKRADGKREMIVAKVLTGDSCTLPPNSNLRMPPEKPSSMNSDDLKIKYDTVNGMTNGSKVYMTYSNEKAYPAYIIIYHHISVGSESNYTPRSSQHNPPLMLSQLNPPPRSSQHNPPPRPSQYNASPRLSQLIPPPRPSQLNPPPRPGQLSPLSRPIQLNPPRRPSQSGQHNRLPSPPKNKCALM